MVTVPRTGGTCHCGRPGGLEACCGPILAGSRVAETAEDLMRSRYSAFVQCDRTHLVRTWDPTTCPLDVGTSPGTEWLGLDVLSTEGGGPLDLTGVVEFVAHFRRQGRMASLGERSRFRRHQGRWVYLDGERL